MNKCKRGHDREPGKNCRTCNCEAQQRWRDANPGESRARALDREKRNPEGSRARTARYKARKLDAVTDGLAYSLTDHCVVCGATDQLEVEHMVPLARGGGDTLSNKTTMCKSCNCSKGTTSVTDPGFTPWLVRRRVRE